MLFSDFPKLTRATDSISNYVSGLGTSDDSTTAGRPTLCGRLDPQELLALYVQDDLARRIVEQIVDDATRKGWKVRDRATQKPLDLPDTAPDIARAQRKAAIWGRLLGAGAVLLVPENGRLNLRSPRPPEEPIKSLVVFDRDELSTQTWNDDPTSEGYGKPLTFDLQPNRAGGVAGRYLGALRDVHRSWLLLYGGSPLPHELEATNDGFDDSILQSVWSVVRRFIQTEQGIANIVSRFETATISIAGLAAAQSAEDGTRLIQERMRLLQSTVSMVNAAIIDADSGEKYERKFAQVSGLDTLWDRLAHSVAKAAGIPMTNLFGMSPSGLSADDKSGRANWRSRVAGYQDAEFRPNLERFYRALNSGRAVDIEFFPLDEITPEEEVLNAESTARTTSILVGAGVWSAEEARDHLRERGLLKSDAPAPEQPVESPNNGPAAQVPKSSGAVRQMVETQDAVKRSYKVPEAARNNARKVLAWKAEHGDAVQGMTDVGWARARQLASSETVGYDTVAAMSAFNRHRKNAEVAAEYADEPWRDAGYVAWLGWGGTSGVDWAREITGAVGR
jgi:phage-related protein (TIGR01555 family)